MLSLISILAFNSVFTSRIVPCLIMRYSTISALLSGASLVQCYPSMKRQDAGNSTANSSATAVDFAAPPGGDATILNYALTLEYLERKFYQEGLNNFTQAQFIAAGFPDPFYANLQEIYADEQVSST